MDEHPNATRVRDGYQAFLNGDFTWLGNALTTDVVWHLPGNNQFSGTYRGQEDVFGLFAKFVEVLGQIPQLEIHDVVGNDRHVVALVTQTLTNPAGETGSLRFVQVFHPSPDDPDKVQEVWTFNEDQAATDAFLASFSG